MSDKTLTCPKCGQSGFLNLKAHHCKAVATIDGNAELVTSNDLKAIAKEVNDGWRDTQALFRKAIERAVYYGSLLMEAKSLLPHGQFGDWIRTECPQIPERTTRQWMVLAQEAVKALPQIKDIDIPAHQLLIAAPNTLTEEQRSVQGDFFALLDGKTQNELLWGFKAQSPRSQGGDNEFLTFLTERHPDLLVDGNPPKRNAVPKDVQAEFTSWKMAKFDPNERVEAARNLANDLADRMVSGIRQLLDEQAACGRPIDLVRRDILIQLEAERVRLNAVMKTLKIR